MKKFAVLVSAAILSSAAVAAPATQAPTDEIQQVVTASAPATDASAPADASGVQTPVPGSGQ
ncbi:MAG: hypothetical protein Q4G28_02545 [Neisseria sp.]|nr:hypothetical protein [Neisseria sp.]